MHIIITYIEYFFYKKWVLYSLIFSFLFIIVLFVGCDGSENADPNVSVRFFHLPYQYPSAGLSYFVTHGDFNRDGAPDLAITNYNTNNVSILLRDSEKGNFKLHVDYSVGKNPGMIVCGDLDSDSSDDLVLVNQSGNSISILYGKGDGTFEDAEEIPLREGAIPMALTLLDVNHDGLMDVAITESQLGEISYILNAGNRTWGEFNYVECGKAPRWLVPVDLDKNGEIDLITSNRDSNNISVLLSQPQSPFSTKNDYPVGTYPRCVDVMDVNGDTYLDVIVANPGSGNYTIFINDTHGGLVETNTLTSHGFPMKFLLNDLNRDGFLDLIGLLYGELTSSTGEKSTGPLGTAEIFSGSQGGNFTYQKTINLGMGAIDIDLVDLDANTQKDLVSTLSGLKRVGVVYGDGEFFKKMEVKPVFDGDIGSLSSGNLDGDSLNEIIMASSQNAYFRVFKIYSDLTLVEKGRWDVSGTVQSMLCTPIDNDNNSVDLVLCERGVMGVSVYLNNGEGVFQKKGVFSVKDPSISHNAYPFSIAVGDVNNDGKRDIVTSNSHADTVSVLLGDGTGAFGVAKETVVGDYPTAAKLADVNRDGNLDLLFVSSRDPDDPNDQSPPRFVCWFGKGDGTFDKDTQKRYATNGSPRGLLLKDLDNDGDYDAVTVHPADKTIVIFGAKEKGAFINKGSIRVGKNPRSIFSWDINGDNMPDLITVNGDGSISVVINEGDLNFSYEYYYYAGYNPISSVPCDIDKDGILDLIIVNDVSRDLSFVFGKNP